MSTGMLNRVRTKVPTKVKVSDYCALTYSLMSYAITVWGKRLIGKRNMCVIYDNFDDQSLANNNLLDYYSIFEYFTGAKLYKILHYNNHDNFSVKLTQPIYTHSNGTRSHAL